MRLEMGLGGFNITDVAVERDFLVVYHSTLIVLNKLVSLILVIYQLVE
jgi:hypothetical protein